MAVSKALTALLQSNLNKVQKPKSYDRLIRKLKRHRPNHKAVEIKQSPENSLRIA